MAAKTNQIPQQVQENFLDSYFTLLHEVYKASELKRKDVEGSVVLCQQLSKPSARPHGHGEDRNTTETVGESQNVAPASGREIKPVPTAEIEALSIAEKALAQAQRLRQKQAKVISRETTLPENENPKPDCPVEQSPHSGEPLAKSGITTASQKNSEKLPAFKKPISRQDLLRQRRSAALPQDRKPDSRNLLVQRRTSQNSSANKIGIRDTISSSNRLGSKPPDDTSSSGKIGGRNSATVNKTTLKNTCEVGVISKSSLDRVLGKSNNGTKTKIGYKPAHTLAPFMTQDVRAKFKSRPVSAGRIKQKTAASKQMSKQHERSDLYHKEKNDAPDKKDCEKNDQQEIKVESQWTEEVLSLAECDRNSQVQTYKSKDVEHSENTKIHTHSQNEPANSTCNKVEEKETTFDILTEGRALEIPSKLRKAVGKNRKLQQQLDLAALKFQASEDNSARISFLNRLTHHYDSQKSDAALVLKTVIQFTALYKKLGILMESLLRIKYNEEYSWQEVIHSKRKMENICLMFVEMEESYSQLISGFKNNGSKLCGGTLTETAQSAYWIPSQFLKDIKLHPSALKYRKLEDLEEYLFLVHQIQLLQLDLLKMEIAAESLLPLLNHIEPEQSSFQALYRAAYTLLCSGGTRGPMIICDIEE